MSGDNFNATFFAGYRNIAGSDADRLAISAKTTFNLKPAKIVAEVAFLTGEDNAGDDQKGLQLAIDGSFAISEAATVGGIFTYAKAYNGANESQIVDFTANDYKPETYGYIANLAAAYSLGNAFDPTGQNTGVIGLQGYGHVKISDALAFKASLAYVMPEDDATNYKSFLTGGISARYALATNTSLDAGIIYSSPEGETGVTAEDAKTLGIARLIVTF